MANAYAKLAGRDDVRPRPRNREDGDVAEIHGHEITKPTIKVIPMSSVTAEELRHLWRYRFYLGKLSLIVGHPGCGKSFLTTFLAAAVSRGSKLPLADGESFPAGDVVLLAAEDDPSDTIRPRLEAHGADLDRIHVVVCVESIGEDGKPLDRMLRFDLDIGRLATLLEQRQAEGRPIKLIVIDTLCSYWGKVDTFKSNEVRAVLGPLVELAAKHNVCIVGISHLNKGGHGPAVTRALGSMAIVGLARSAWLVCHDPDDPLAETGTSTRRLFLAVKSNLGPPQPGLAFEITDNGIVWTEQVGMTADRALAPPQRKREEKDKGHALREACEWLETRLGDSSEHESDVVRAEAKEAGISFGTFRRAKEDIGVISRKDRGLGGKWFLTLPPKDAQPPVDFEHDEHLEHVEHVTPIPDEFIGDTF
jgi:energy-coupling factor transporter ATP-binding protein EcfA2